MPVPPSQINTSDVGDALRAIRIAEGRQPPCGVGKHDFTRSQVANACSLCGKTKSELYTLEGVYPGA